MSAKERQQAFEAALRAQTGIASDARIAPNFGFSNSARVLEGGLFAGTTNFDSLTKALLAGAGGSQQVLVSVLVFPPEDEVYFGVSITSGLPALNQALLKLAKQVEVQNAKRVAEGKKPGEINNNVKVYITGAGDLYFQSQGFHASLKEAEEEGLFDPDCRVPVDDIFFSIWPPAASAGRGLLARQLAGYLGSLVGRQKVHEIRAWADQAAPQPEMRRLPADLPIADLEAAVAAQGGHYPHGEVARYHAGLSFLPHKHFVILSGLSGTGKTQLALKYARAVHGVETGESDPFLFVCPVRPEWTDPSGLTGYYDVLSNRYQVPPFLEAVLLATAHRESPVFVVLDEMNLARVEYYLSDILSAIETGEPLQLHASGVNLEGSTGESVPASLPVPPNLYITGTINVDETTNPVSEKVLDRAVVIDMTAVDLEGFFGKLELRHPELKTARAACESHLLAVQALMAPHNLGFGYRVTEEAVRYQAFAQKHLSASAASVTDDLLVQKVLVKLRGGERQRPLLTGLAKALAGFERSQAVITRLTDDLDEYGAFQAGR